MRLFSCPEEPEPYLGDMIDMDPAPLVIYRPETEDYHWAKRLAVVIAGVLAVWFGLIYWAAAAQAETGIASVYSGLPDEGGSRASNGERIQPGKLTAACRSTPACWSPTSAITASALGFSGLAPVTVEALR